MLRNRQNIRICNDVEKQLMKQVLPCSVSLVGSGRSDGHLSTNQCSLRVAVPTPRFRNIVQLIEQTESFVRDHRQTRLCV